MSCLVTKPTKSLYAQRRLRSAWASAQSDQSFRCPLNGYLRDPSFLHVDSEDSDQIGQMPRLIWVFAGRTLILLVLSWGGSNLVTTDLIASSSVTGFILLITCIFPAINAIKCMKWQMKEAKLYNIKISKELWMTDQVTIYLQQKGGRKNSSVRKCWLGCSTENCLWDLEYKTCVEQWRWCNKI